MAYLYFVCNTRFCKKLSITLLLFPLENQVGARDVFRFFLSFIQWVVIYFRFYRAEKYRR
ncbi:hypothetical protein VAE151_631026 [Vibrio aestuarianus]|nr:hypothetical protein VAE128_501018 [Vibrio aestuarianus]CAH8233214.1 hypothetical protein VAE055_421029 [Vibrio aestuarianus]CAH8233738.1 hypothetical protein VAE130_601028 [Vibrio aestuarianus]CAH8238842.1 hypothetical protein VAE142_931026 [Vibrio aestuarianus]CAH8240068.1 hypothetical protein VAE016_411024 [Vibrio aestuarianus]